MPTDEDRREVAAKLRELVADWFDDGEFYDRGEVEDVLGLATDDGAWYEAAGVRRLADLIEPEERTCRNTAGKPFAGHRMFSCSECGAYLEVDGGADANLFAGGERPMPHYCPNCGAKVVDEAHGEPDGDRVFMWCSHCIEECCDMGRAS